MRCQTCAILVPHLCLCHTCATPLSASLIRGSSAPLPTFYLTCPLAPALPFHPRSVSRPATSALIASSPSHYPPLAPTGRLQEELHQQNTALAQIKAQVGALQSEHRTQAVSAGVTGARSNLVRRRPLARLGLFLKPGLPVPPLIEANDFAAGS